MFGQQFKDADSHLARCRSRYRDSTDECQRELPSVATRKIPRKSSCRVVHLGTSEVSDRLRQLPPFVRAAHRRHHHLLGQLESPCGGIVSRAL